MIWVQQDSRQSGTGSPAGARAPSPMKGGGAPSPARGGGAPSPGPARDGGAPSPARGGRAGARRSLSTAQE